MTQEGTGDEVVRVALEHLEERYVLGARAPMGNSKWTGPWDCAEFASWCVYQATGVLYGTQPRGNPVLADAYTGYWYEQSRGDEARTPVDAAVAIPGALLLRAPAAEAIGHIAISDGSGGTVEAHSTRLGVTRGKASGRRWDTGVLVPGVHYFQSEHPVVFAAPTTVYRVTTPLMRGPTIRKIQRALVEVEFHPGRADGVYGPQTAHAVQQFQAARGLVADGEVGALTLKALGVVAK